MTIGGSLLLIALGAILRYAVADVWEAVELPTVGLILMIVGGVGFIAGLIMMATMDRDRGDRTVAVEERRTRV